MMDAVEQQQLLGAEVDLDLAPQAAAGMDSPGLIDTRKGAWSPEVNIGG